MALTVRPVSPSVALVVVDFSPLLGLLAVVSGFAIGFYLAGWERFRAFESLCRSRLRLGSLGLLAWLVFFVSIKLANGGL